MKAYVYMISFLEYGDSAFYPVFSHKKYSGDEFKSLCTRVHRELSFEYFDTDFFRGQDMGRLIRDRLCSRHGFFKRDITCYIMNDSSVVDYSYF